MSLNTLKILFIADIVGNPGIHITLDLVKSLTQKHETEFCIANGENANNGKGLSSNIVNRLLDAGVNVITSGNHVWEKDAFIAQMDKFKMVLRPANYPSENMGEGTFIHTLPDNTKIAVINVQGRTFMPTIDCPFKKAMGEVRRLRKITNLIIVDMHAEATAEKIAFGNYLDGKVSAVIGTHTHVQTADEKILHNGTAYITDAGMTGPVDSVIGMKKEIAVKRFIYQTPFRYQVADGLAQLNGVVLEVDKASGKAITIKRIAHLEDEGNQI